MIAEILITPTRYTANGVTTLERRDQRGVKNPSRKL
jgi:hypothetical protein